MIIVKLTDGLGNQMFQYALARKLAYANKTELCIDMSWFEVNKFRGRRVYQLDVFNVNNRKFNLANDTWNFLLDKLHFTRNIFKHKCINTIKKEIQPNELIFVREKNLKFNADIIKIKGDLYLEGYWQSEKYFKDIREYLLKDFIFKGEFTGKNNIVDRLIQNTEKSVSLHIRRGDYVGSDFDVCNLDYYYRAINYLVNKIGENIKIFIFSNDIDWVKENLHTNYEVVFVDHNDETNGYNDMRLMSLCKHNIIANSSFSWWAAWLNTYNDKIVIAPKRWFNNDTDIDIVCDDWVKL